MSDNTISGEMIRGHIDTIILLSLTHGDMDSNEIRSDIEAKSGNKYSVKQGTFYSAMSRLIKQNYITEYRSSAIDGIRRKYYKLTDKGRSFLDKNRSEWNNSKGLIDDLIETPTKQVKKELPKKQQNDSDIEAFKALAEDIGDFKIERVNVSDDLLGDIGEKLKNDLEVFESETPSEQIVIPDKKTDIIGEIKENYENDFPAETITKETETAEDEATQTENTPVENVAAESAADAQITNEKDEKDDFLYVEDQMPVRHEYKSLLNRLFPKDKVETLPNKIELKQENDERGRGDVQVTFAELLPDRTANKEKESDISDKREVYADNTEDIVIEQTDGAIDFSDLYEMARREKFKVKTSFSTNKHSEGEIYINKLRFHASLLFYLILFAEMALLNIVLYKFIAWSTTFKIAAAAIAFVFPLAMTIARIVKPDRKTDNLSTFKDAMEIVLIIALQLLIIIMGVSLFASIDFSNYRAVISYIILPAIIAINLPLYVVIKYTLLQSGKYSA